MYINRYIKEKVYMKNYCLITGASSGLGKDFAKKLVKDYNLILVARRLERLIELCEGKGIEYDEDRVGTDGTILSLLQAVKYLVSLLNAVDNSNDDITRTDASRAIKRIITIDGRIVTKPVHGFVIIQTTDGRAKKVIMK